MRTPIVPVPAPSGAGRPARAGRTSVRGPGQKQRASCRAAGGISVATVSTTPRSLTSTRIAFPSSRPRTATCRSTAASESASAPSPYTVSVGKTTRPPAASAAIAASAVVLRRDLPLQTDVLPLDALRQLDLEALEAGPDRAALEPDDLRRQDGGILGTAAADRHRRDRHARGHLHGGEERVEPLERARRAGDADHGDRRVRRDHARQVGGCARAGD